MKILLSLLLILITIILGSYKNDFQGQESSDIALAPISNPITMSATTSTTSVRITGTVSPTSKSTQTVAIYIGAPGSTIVDSSPTNYATSFSTFLVGGESTYSYMIPLSVFYDLGYINGGVMPAYFAAYVQDMDGAVSTVSTTISVRIP